MIRRRTPGNEVGTMSHFARLLCLATVAVYLFGCGGFGVVGNGQKTTQARELQAFKRIDVSGGLSVKFTKGARGATVTGDDNLVSHVDTVVQGDVLVVRMRHPVADVGSLEVAVSNGLMEGLSLSGGSRFVGVATPVTFFDLDASGSSHVELEGVTSDDVSVDASGASEVLLIGGSTKKLSVSASGASKVTSHGFDAAKVNVEISGASSACVTATESISGSASGASTVTVSGSPATLNVSSSGGSRLIKES